MRNFFNQHKSALLLAGFGLTLLAGLGLGYLLFRSEPASSSDSATHDHGAASAGTTTWTCSMHPQIRQEEPGDCPICGMDLIPMEKTAATDPLVLEMTPEAVKLAQVETTMLGPRQEATQTLRLAGKIQADERRASSQVSHFPGRIEQLLVSFKGEYVQAGQRVARLYSPELITAQQELWQARQLQDRNPALYAAARQKLRYWKLTEAQIDAIAESDTLQQSFDLYAGASGVVTNQRVAVGDYVRQGEGLFDLVDLSRVWVLFDAYEQDLPKLAVGDRVEFTTPAAPGQAFSTRISFIDPVIDPTTRVASVRAEVANVGGKLKPEMLVKGSLLAPVKAGESLVVPKSAVLWTGKRSVVYVKVPELSVPSFRYQEVELGERVGGDYLVESGLQAGDEVVTYGNFAIDAAAQLNNQQSMMNQLLAREETAADSLPDFRAAVPTVFREQLGQLLGAYLALKDQLVASAPAEAQAAGQQVAAQLKAVDMGQLSGEAHAYWMRKADSLTAAANALAGTEALPAQRKAFEALSTQLIEVVEVFGGTGDTLFVQHCPMAFDWQGADWLSRQEEIRNPYFGDEMLTCGSVTQQLPAQAQ